MLSTPGQVPQTTAVRCGHDGELLSEKADAERTTGLVIVLFYGVERRVAWLACLPTVVYISLRGLRQRFVCPLHPSPWVHHMGSAWSCFEQGALACIPVDTPAPPPFPLL